MLRLNRLFSVLVCLLCLKGFSQNTKDGKIEKAGFLKEIVRMDNDTIFYIRNKNCDKKPKPTIIFLQGSLPIPLFYEYDKVLKLNLPFDIKDYNEKYNFIVISRKGVPLILDYESNKNGYFNYEGKPFLGYEKFNNLGYRHQQVAFVLDDLLKKEWVDKKAVYIIGHSEGYRVAASLAENNNKIVKLVCMSADPFNRIAEDMIRERIGASISVNQILANENVSNLVEDYKSIGDDIEKFKNDIELYNWMSYNKSLSFESLKKYSGPILVVYGADDVTAAHNDLLPFLLKNNRLTLKSYPGFNHNYFKKEYDVNNNRIEDSYHWDEVFKDVINWLEQKEN